MRDQLFTWIIAVYAVSAFQAGASNATAQECVNDEDCVMGYACQVVAKWACDLKCPEGETCISPELVDCGPQKACVPLPCDSDADCAEGMLCDFHTFKVCGGGYKADCSGDGGCDEPVVTQCHSDTTSICVPRYKLRCEQDDDCGDGFTCEETAICGCAASAGDNYEADAKGDPEAPQDAGASGEQQASESCGCVPTGEYHCEMRKVDCSEDSDCLQGWTCSDWDYATSLCETPEVYKAICSSDPLMVAKICLPPYQNLGWVDPDVSWTRQDTDQITLDTSSEGENGDVFEASSGDVEVATVVEPNGSAPTEEGTPAEKASEFESDDGCQVVNIGAASSSSLAWIGSFIAILAVRRRFIGRSNKGNK